MVGDSSASAVLDENRSKDKELSIQSQVSGLRNKRTGTRGKKSRGGYITCISVFAFFLVVALIMFYPITLHMTKFAPGTGADTYQNLWDIWWVKYAVFNLHTNVFYTNMIFWPIGVNLAYSTISPLLGIVSAPFQAFGTPFAYNVMFLLGFALSGLTMYVLADYLTKNSYASLISGFVFAFSALHIAQSYSHIHFMQIEWIPLSIYFFLKIVNNDRRLVNIVGMSASFALTTLMGNVEQTIMLSLALVLLIVMYLLIKDTRRNLLKLGFLVSMVLFVVFAFAIGSWNFIPLLHSITQPGGLGTANYINTHASNVQWSASLGGLFIPSYYNGIFYSSGVPAGIYNSIFAPDPVEKVAYIGYVVIALAALAIYKNGRKMLPWAVGFAIFIWLALGPNFGLYSLYHAVPGINVIREPGRFDLIAALFIAILAAYGSRSLFEYFGNERGGRKTSYALLIIILALMFVENNGMHIGGSPYEITQINVPSVYRQLAGIPGNFSVLELPTFPVGQTGQYLYPGMETYYTSVSHKPLVGGYTGRQNSSTALLLYNIPLAVQTSYLIANGTGAYPSPVNENYTNETLLTLFNYNTTFVILQKGAFNSQQLPAMEQYLVNVFGEPVQNDNSTMVFETNSSISRSIFKSFVAYPILTYWSSTSLFVNGSYQTFWMPDNPGGMVVYAPYPENSPSGGLQGLSYVNATIRLVAFSNSPQQLYIAEPASGNRTRVIATLNVTTRPELYTANTQLISGPSGNILYLIYSSNNSPVLINNITFTR